MRIHVHLLSLGIALLGLPLIGLPLIAQAQQPPVLPFPPAPPSAGAVLSQHLAQGLLAGIERSLDRAPFAIEVTLQAPPKGAQVAVLAAFVADSLEAALRRVARPGARVEAGAAEQTITVGLSLGDGQLSATARRVRRPMTVWEHFRAPDGHVVGTAFASVALDMELRTLLGWGGRPVQLSQLRYVPITKRCDDRLTRGRTLDLLVGDLDGDRQPEVAVLHERALHIGRWRKGGLRDVLASYDLATFAPNPRRLRDPIGRVVRVTMRDGSSALVVASADRSGPVVLRFAAGGLREVAAPGLGAQLAEHGALWPLYASGVERVLMTTWPAATDVLQGPLREIAFAEGEAALELGPSPAVHDIRAFGHFGASSPPWSPRLAQALAGGRLVLDRASHPDSPVRLPSAGFATALVDLDADGTPELLTTSTAATGRDQLVLRRLRPDGPEAVWQGEAPAPVTALAGGDIDRDGYEEVVIATWHGVRSGLAVLAPVSR